MLTKITEELYIDIRDVRAIKTIKFRAYACAAEWTCAITDRYGETHEFEGDLEKVEEIINMIMEANSQTVTFAKGTRICDLPKVSDGVPLLVGEKCVNCGTDADFSCARFDTTW